MEGTLKVTPQELQRTAASFSSRGQAIASTTESMMNLVNNLASTWEGEASEAYIRTFRGLQNDMELINRKIQEHASDLNEIANNYIRSEDSGIQSHSALPQDALE